MGLIICGHVWKFSDNIDTDTIIPSPYIVQDMSRMAKHAMEPIDSAFAKKVKTGDVLVGGRNFGCGSSREEAAGVLKHLGVGIIVAESFARIFFRNAINIGLPLLECKEISTGVRQGDEVQVTVETGEVRNLTTGLVLRGKPLPEFMLKIVSAGGIVSLLKEEAQTRKKKAGRSASEV